VVTFNAHPSTTSETLLATSKSLVDVVFGNLQAGRNAFDDRRQAGAV
jgi:hypothetical protein